MWLKLGTEKERKFWQDDEIWNTSDLGEWKIHSKKISIFNKLSALGKIFAPTDALRKKELILSWLLC